MTGAQKFIEVFGTQSMIAEVSSGSFVPNGTSSHIGIGIVTGLLLALLGLSLFCLLIGCLAQGVMRLFHWSEEQLAHAFFLVLGTFFVWGINRSADPIPGLMQLLFVLSWGILGLVVYLSTPWRAIHLWMTNMKTTTEIIEGKTDLIREPQPAPATCGVPGCCLHTKESKPRKIYQVGYGGEYVTEKGEMVRR